MKKLIFTAALIFLFLGVTFGQSLQKGNIIRTTVATIDLKPGVTMEQWTEFIINRTIPEIEKNFKGWKLYPLKKISGEHENDISVILVIESEEYFYKYINEDGSLTEAGQAAEEKLQSLYEERNEKLGTLTLKETFWLIR